MHRRATVALALTAIAASALSATPPAGAAPAPAPTGTVSGTSPSCGRLTLRNTTRWVQNIVLEGPGSVVLLPPQRTTTLTVAGGDQVWTFSPGLPTEPTRLHWTRVARCPGGPVLPVQGDENGDGRADLLAVTATGDLFYYPMTARGLAEGRRVGRGWGSMLFVGRAQRLAREDFGIRAPQGPALVAVQGDRMRSVWRFPALGGARYGAGARLADTNMQRADRFSMLPPNTLPTGWTTLLGTEPANDHTVLARTSLSTKTNAPYGLSSQWRDVTRTIGVRDFDGDHAADVLSVHTDGTLRVQHIGQRPNDIPRLGADTVVGRGWGGMDLVMSPGSVDGDALSDIVARHRNGDLYLYRNLGGHLAAGVRIGRHWNGIRLLA